VSTNRAVGTAEDGLARQGTRFVLVGIVNTAFGFGLFAALELTFGDQVPYIYLLLVAHVVSVLEAYVLQRSLVFRVEGRWWGDLVRFWSVYAAALALNLLALPLLVEALGLPVLLSQALFLLLMTAGTFAAHRTFSFRRPSAQDDRHLGSGAT
jgi:putative flippase GtrA